MKKIAVIMICMLVVPILATADLTIREKTHVRAFMGAWASEGSELTYIKGDMMRSESETEKTGMGSARGMKNPPAAVTIIRLDKGLVWHVNTLDKTYMESPFELLPESDDVDLSGLGLKDLTVEKTDETREVMGKKCDGVRASITFETEGSDGPVEQTFDVMFWMTSEVKALAEMRGFWETMIEVSQGQKEKVPMGDVMEQLWEEVGEEGKVPLAMDMSVTSSSLNPEDEAKMRASLEAMGQMMGESGGEDDMAMRMSREIISISDENLNDALFEVPKDYRKAKGIRMW
ncbi:hypothetical protein ACFL2Z_05005 [Candidatus Eisenbacteria bacterium]|uniref:DUF4412 domain-containing protein n=1 Tax=Eiseniibacteriota bacterium TaxID=2212470 RepID=A0ABV6YQP1_UNCEI